MKSKTGSAERGKQCSTPGVESPRLSKNFKLLPETNKRLERLAAEMRVSQAEIVRRAIGQLYRTAIKEVDPKEQRIERRSIRELIEPILEFAWGGRLLNVTTRQYAQILADLFPEVYDDQCEPEAKARKARVDAEKAAMIDAAREGEFDETVD